MHLSTPDTVLLPPRSPRTDTPMRSRNHIGVHTQVHVQNVGNEMHKSATHILLIVGGFK